jgi:hypothetical protein
MYNLLNLSVKHQFYLISQHVKRSGGGQIYLQIVGFNHSYTSRAVQSFVG